VVVKNIPETGGITGNSALIVASPDVITGAFISNNRSVNPSVLKSVSYDSLNDTTPVNVFGDSPCVLGVNPTKVPKKRERDAGPAQGEAGRL